MYQQSCETRWRTSYCPSLFLTYSWPYDIRWNTEYWGNRNSQIMGQKCRFVSYFPVSIFTNRAISLCLSYLSLSVLSGALEGPYLFLSHPTVALAHHIATTLILTFLRPSTSKPHYLAPPPFHRNRKSNLHFLLLIPGSPPYPSRSWNCLDDSIGRGYR